MTKPSAAAHGSPGVGLKVLLPCTYLSEVAFNCGNCTANRLQWVTAREVQ